MKIIIKSLIICFLMVQVSFAQETLEESSVTTKQDIISLDWSKNYKSALKRAKKEKKPILIYFTGSDWCGPCKILDRDLFHTEKFKDIADRDLVLLEVDIPRRLDILSPKKMKENKDLQKKYKVKAFPTLMMVNHRGKKIAEKKGYIITEYYYPFFQSIISKY